MRPEAAAGAREARGRVCHCPADGSRRPPSPRGPESAMPWRPWTLTPGDAQRTRTGSRVERGRERRLPPSPCFREKPEPGGDQQTPGSKGAFGFQHPVRLYLPISKRQEYLQSSGEKVLASFPVQATIHFYNDDSDSEDAEHEEEARPSDLQCREAEGPEDNGPGGQGRGWLTHPEQGSGGQGGHDGKGLLPGCHSPGSALCSSSK